MTPLLLFLLSLLVLSPPAEAQTVGCVRAREMYRRGVRSRDTARKAESYGMAVRSCPDYAEAHNNLADALERLGRLREAERHYREAARLKPDLAVAHFGLGDILRKLGRNADAIESYRRGLRLAPDDLPARAGLAKARAALPPGDPRQLVRAEEIEGHFTQVTRMGPGGSRLGGLAFRNILFGFGSSELRRESFAQLEEMGKALSRLAREREMRFRVEGHTDSKGSEAYNLSLSRKRAMAVARYLIERRGVPRSSLRAVGRGESVPVATNETDEGRRLNRRVEIVLEK